MADTLTRFQAALPDLELIKDDDSFDKKKKKELATELVSEAALLWDVVGERSQAVNDVIKFCGYIDPSYESATHLLKIGDKLKEVRKYIETGGKQGIGRLMISVPPRHGKTLTVTKRWPAQLLGLHNDWRVALVSYSSELATDASRALRAVIRDDPDYRNLFPGVGLSDESQSVQRWSLHGIAKDDPSVVAVGVSGSLIGRGFHLIIIDDPHKGRQEAESEAHRKSLQAWYTGTLRHRLEPGGAIVIIQTRWHEDDLVGWLLDEYENGEGEEWEVINFPALAEDEDDAGNPVLDPLGRKKGQALWPKRYNKNTLQNLKRVLGPYDWASQFQGRPQPAGGGKIKRDWLQIIEPLNVPKKLIWARYYDLAISVKEGSSRTATCRCAFDEDGNLYVAGMVKGRWEWPQQRQIIKATILAEHAAGVEHGVESAIHGTAAVQDLRQDPDLFGTSFRKIDVHVDKLTRALPWIAIAADSKLYLVNGGWVSDFISEAVVFTGHQDKYNDQIDAVSGAVSMLAMSAQQNLTIQENPLYS